MSSAAPVPSAASSALELSSRWWETGESGGTRTEEVLAALRTQPTSTRPSAIRDLRGIRLLDEDLHGLNLTGCDLRGADLSRSDLRGARLVAADLRGAVLQEAQLDGADLTKARLDDARLASVHAVNAGFGYADLSGAVLFGAHLTGSTFTAADLSGADLRTARAESCGFRDADLRRIDVTSACLREADLTGCRVDHACFDEVDLRRASMTRVSGYATASWIGADVRDVDFCGAWLLRRHVLDENYLHEFRSQSTLNEWVYRAWWVTSDCGRSAFRWAALTVTIAAVFAGLYGLVAIDYGANETWLSPLYYSVVTLTTLGYGDVLPASAWAQTAAMVQVIIGYVMLGGLLSIFSNKMARRAD